MTWLLRLGAEVCGFSSGVPTVPSLFAAAGLEERIRHQVGDVRDRAALEAAVDAFRPDCVFHLAAQAVVSASYDDPLGTITTNVVGTATLLDVLRRLQWPCACVVVTSDKAYSNVEWVWGYRENDRLGGNDIYGGSKAAAELVFEAYSRSFFGDGRSPVRLASARAGNVIGGGDWARDRIVADCMRAWTAGNRVRVRSVTATRPWQHVLEPLSGYLALAADLMGAPRLNGECLNFGPRADQDRTVLDLLVSLAVSWDHPAAQDAYEVDGRDASFREARLLRLNIDKASALLRWQPTLAFDEAVLLTGQWYRQVCRDGQDAYAVTEGQIEAYEHRAGDTSRHWFSP